MSLAMTCCLTLVRSLVLVAAALPLCEWLCRFLRHRVGPWRRIAFVLLLLPIVAPRLVTGYGYANFALSLLPYPIWNELMYDALVLLTIVPIGTIMIYFAPPPPISAEGTHCWTLSYGHRTASGALERWRDGCRVWMRGRVCCLVPAGCLMHLVAFQEFELASLMGVHSWTVWLFDAQAGGLYLSESLRYAIIPLLTELAVLIPFSILVARNAGLLAAPKHGLRCLTRRGQVLVWCYLALGPLLICLIPWSLIVRSAMPGFSQLWRDPHFAGDIAAGCLFAAASALGAYGLAWRLVSPTTRATVTRRAVTSGLLSVPGLVGALVLALSLLFVFQLPVINVAYDTAIPWLVALMLVLFPRALVLAVLIQVTSSMDSRHVARLQLESPCDEQRNRAFQLSWRTRVAVHFAAFLLLFYWGYADLTTAAILSPTGIVSAPVRLYNLMHYGQSAVLSAMVIAAFGAPLLLAIVLRLLKRPILRVFVV